MEMALGGACDAIQHSSPSMQCRLLLILRRRRGLGLKLVLQLFVPDADLKRSCDLLDTIVGKADMRKLGVDALMDLATQCQDTAAFSLIERKLKPPTFCPFY
jgi:hypothetical protein